jgi:DDE superfamily endonuclease
MWIGQKNGCVRQWAPRGTRPRQPADQRYESTYVFGAVCPARDTGAMQRHIDEITRHVESGALAVVLMDNAAWHRTGKLRWPENVRPMFIPPGCPELNAAENIWQFLRQTYLSSRVFDPYQAIVDAACSAWNRLMAEPDRIAAIATGAGPDRSTSVRSGIIWRAP